MPRDPTVQPIIDSLMLVVGVMNMALDHLVDAIDEGRVVVDEADLAALQNAASAWPSRWRTEGHGLEPARLVPLFGSSETSRNDGASQTDPETDQDDPQT